jgi:septal ring-binding cell division protein DamX
MGGASGATLLKAGSLQEAARTFAGSLAAGPRSRYSVQLLTACSPQTVQNAVAAVDGGELFILPVQFQGRACYRICWGVYGSREQAEAAASAVPAYFRRGGAHPRPSPLAEILP